MPYLFNLLYFIALLALSPLLLWKAWTTGKYRRGMLAKLRGLAPRRDTDRPCAWFHGVSVGEVHLLRQVVAAFRRRHPRWDCIISTTTDTGFDEASKHFADLSVFFWPLDFSWAVRRALRTVNPTLVVLAEGELWPNFLTAAREHGTLVAIVNGRMSPRSLRNYQRIGWLSRRLFSGINLIVAQTEEYATRYRTLGAPVERVSATGNVKFDGVSADRQNARTRDLAHLFRVEPGDLVWVCGSTQGPEEVIALDIFGRLRAEFPALRLFLVPRQRERFEDVAQLLQRRGESFLRRSTLTEPVSTRPAVVLVDTIGELGALWGLADVAFVGGSLDGRRGGQNMIEPAAYGASVLFGPHVWNFAETARRLVEAEAAIQISDTEELEATVRRLLGDVAERQRIGRDARQFVQRQQGATERTIDLLEGLLVGAKPANRAA
jgi:3-deoxy-D-manno-octulosonic-acid transferase